MHSPAPGVLATSHSCHSLCVSCPNWGPRYCGSEKSCQTFALSEFSTHRTHEHNKMAVAFFTPLSFGVMFLLQYIKRPWLVSACCGTPLAHYIAYCFELLFHFLSKKIFVLSFEQCLLSNFSYIISHCCVVGLEVAGCKPNLQCCLAWLRFLVKDLIKHVANSGSWITFIPSSCRYSKC